MSKTSSPQDEGSTCIGWMCGSAVNGGGSGGGGACSVGQVLSPGQSCTVNIPGVNVGSNRCSDGSGCYGNICAGSGFQADCPHTSNTQRRR